MSRSQSVAAGQAVDPMRAVTGDGLTVLALDFGHPRMVGALLREVRVDHPEVSHDAVLDTCRSLARAGLLHARMEHGRQVWCRGAP